MILTAELHQSPATNNNMIFYPAIGVILALSCLHPGLATPEPLSQFDMDFYNAMLPDYGGGIPISKIIFFIFKMLECQR